MKIFATIIIIFLVLIGVSFAGLNAEHVTLNYYFGELKLPLSLLLVLTLLLGCLLGIFAGFIAYLRQKSQIYKLRCRIKTFEKEISNLRTIPLKDNR